MSPRAVDAHLVAPRRKFVADLRSDARLDPRATGIGSVGIERAREMCALDRWRVERLLHVHAEVDHVQEELERPLVLLIAAGRAKGQPRLPVAQRQRRGEGRAWSLAWNQRVGVALVQVEHLAARPEWETETFDNR